MKKIMIDKSIYIPFGLEIEAESIPFDEGERVLQHKIDEKWVIGDDGSLYNGGIELSSPVIPNENKSFVVLKKIASTLKYLCATFAQASLQINFDANQFTDNDILYMLKIFSIYENIIYRFSTGEDEFIRESASEYASPIARLFRDDYSKKGSLVKKLKKNRSDLEGSKTYLKLFPIVCGIGTFITCLAFCVTSPSIYIPMLPLMLGFSGIVSSILIGYGIANYFICKHDYKKIATKENLELENIIDSILALNVTLQDKLAKANVKLANYKDLVEYLSEYNDKFSLLEVVKLEDEIEIDNLFNEYLDEKIDYSKVHFDNDTLREDIQIKKLNK